MRYPESFQELLEDAALSFHMKGYFGVDSEGREGIIYETKDEKMALWNPLESSTQALALLGEHNLRLTYKDGNAIIDSETRGHLVTIDFNNTAIDELICLQGGFSALGLTKEVRQMMAGRYAVTLIAASLGRGLVVALRRVFS
jgi:hypothetical protein